MRLSSGKEPTAFFVILVAVSQSSSSIEPLFRVSSSVFARSLSYVLYSIVTSILASPPAVPSSPVHSFLFSGLLLSSLLPPGPTPTRLQFTSTGSALSAAAAAETAAFFSGEDAAELQLEVGSSMILLSSAPAPPLTSTRS